MFLVERLMFLGTLALEVFLFGKGDIGERLVNGGNGKRRFSHKGKF